MTHIMQRTVLFLTLILTALIVSAQGTYTVNAKVLNVRSKPSKSSAVVGALHRGTTVEIEHIESGWGKMSLNGRNGYVSMKYMQGPVAQPEVPKANKTATRYFWDDFNIPKTDSPLWFYIMVALAAIVTVVQIASQEGDRYKYTKWLFYITSIVFLALSLSEIVYFLAFDGSKIWFCMPSQVGWLMTVVDYILFGILLYGQIMAFMSLIHASNYLGCRNSNISVGYYGWIAGIIALIVTAIFFKAYVNYVALAIIGVQTIQLIMFVYYNIKDGGGWLNLIFTIVLYTLGSIATIIALLHFLTLTIVVIIGYIVLRAITSGNSRCCANCVTYDDGYCSYRRCNVSAGSCCNKFR